MVFGEQSNSAQYFVYHTFDTIQCIKLYAKYLLLKQLVKDGCKEKPDKAPIFYFYKTSITIKYLQKILNL